jgi:hypothetical protein
VKHYINIQFNLGFKSFNLKTICSGISNVMQYLKPIQFRFHKLPFSNQMFRYFLCEAIIKTDRFNLGFISFNLKTKFTGISSSL